jgi:hypothetical protein
VSAKGSKISVSLYHTTAVGSPSTVPGSAVWYEKYLESTNGGSTFTALATADPTAVKKGPICTDGINCDGNRELGDFQQVAIDKAGKANLAYNRSLNSTTGDVQVRTVRQL